MALCAYIWTSLSIPCRRSDLAVFTSFGCSPASAVGDVGRPQSLSSLRSVALVLAWGGHLTDLADGNPCKCSEGPKFSSDGAFEPLGYWMIGLRRSWLGEVLGSAKTGRANGPWRACRRADEEATQNFDHHSDFFISTSTSPRPATLIPFAELKAIKAIEISRISRSRS